MVKVFMFRCSLRKFSFKRDVVTTNMLRFRDVITTREKQVKKKHKKKLRETINYSSSYSEKDGC